MQKYFNNAFNRNGIPLVSATVTVYNYGTTTLSSLFSDNTGTTVKTNPITTDANGHFEFYAANARYTISVVATGYVNNTYDDILLNDTYSASPSVIVGGSVDASPIGATTPSTGVFTKLTSTGSTTGAGLDAINFGATGVPTRLGWNNSGNYYNWIEAGGSPGATYLRFATNNSEVARITNTGLDVTGTLSATGAVSGAGFATYLASPPAIGGTTPNAGTFTSLNGGPLAGLRNRIINGSMVCDQRNSGAAVTMTATPTVTYSVDRFPTRLTAASTGNEKVQRVAGDANSPYALRLLRNAGTFSGGALEATQVIESSSCYSLSGKTASISMRVRSGSAYQGVFSFFVAAGTGVDQGISSAIAGTWTGINYPTVTMVSSPAISTTFQTYSATVPVPAGTTEFVVFMRSTYASGTGTANDYIDITDLQLEVGSTATPFEQRPIGMELALCQRYYYRITPGVATTMLTPSAWVSATTNAYGAIQFPVTMRTAPTALEQDGTAGNYRTFIGITGTLCNSVPVFNSATVNGALTGFPTAGGLTVGQAGYITNNAVTTTYLGWSAEL